MSRAPRPSRWRSRPACPHNRAWVRAVVLGLLTVQLLGVVLACWFAPTVLGLAVIAAVCGLGILPYLVGGQRGLPESECGCRHCVGSVFAQVLVERELFMYVHQLERLQRFLGGAGLTRRLTDPDRALVTLTAANGRPLGAAARGPDQRAFRRLTDPIGQLAVLTLLTSGAPATLLAVPHDELAPLRASLEALAGDATPPITMELLEHADEMLITVALDLGKTTPPDQAVILARGTVA